MSVVSMFMRLWVCDIVSQLLEYLGCVASGGEEEETQGAGEGRQNEEAEGFQILASFLSFLDLNVQYINWLIKDCLYNWIATRDLPLPHVVLCVQQDETSLSNLCKHSFFC